MIDRSSATRLAGAALFLAALAACDDTTFLSGAEGGAATGTGYCGVVSIFEASCLQCHSAASALGGLDLETDAAAALVDVPSQYPGRTLVVPGDPDNSFLVVKLRGEQVLGEGSTMPPSPLAASSIDVVAQWITDGAPSTCDSTGTVPPPPDCDTTNEDCGPGSCGGAENAQMLPGADCLACHSQGGDSEAPRFVVGGTAFADPSGTAPLVGATVRVTDAEGNQYELLTNAAGNFYKQAGADPFVFPFSAEIEFEGQTRSMATMPSTGGCNECHRCDGQAGAKLY